MKRSTLLAIFSLLTLANLTVNAQFHRGSARNTKVDLYGNEVVAEPVERPESSPSSPPLDTDDPGTPGTNGYEINFILNCDKSKDSRGCEAGIDAAFGIGESIQIRISKSRVQNSPTGEPTMNGYGTTDLGVKYRFYDKNGLAIAVFPSYRFNDGTRFQGNDGQPIEPDGRSIYLPLIISKEVGHYTIVVNLAAERNLDYSDKNAVFSSIAIGRALNYTTRVMAEVASERSTSFLNRETTMRVGIVKVFPIANSRYQVSWFGSIGRTIGTADDGQVHIKALTGFSFSRKPTN